MTTKSSYQMFSSISEDQEKKKINEFNEKKIRKLTKNLEEFNKLKDESNLDNFDINYENQEILKNKIIKQEIYLFYLEQKLDKITDKLKFEYNFEVSYKNDSENMNQANSYQSYLNCEDFQDKLLTCKKTCKNDLQDDNFKREAPKGDTNFRQITDKLERIVENSKEHKVSNTVFEQFLQFTKPRVEINKRTTQEEKLFQIYPTGIELSWELAKFMESSFIGQDERPSAYSDDGWDKCQRILDHDSNLTQPEQENRFFLISYDSGLNTQHTGLVFKLYEFHVQLRDREVCTEVVDARWTVFTCKSYIEIFKAFIVYMYKKKLRWARYFLKRKRAELHTLNSNPGASKSQITLSVFTYDVEQYTRQMKCMLDKLYRNKLITNNIFRLDDGFAQSLHAFEASLLYRCMYQAFHNLTFEEIVLLIQILMVEDGSKIQIVGDRPEVVSQIALFFQYLMEKFKIDNFISIFLLNENSNIDELLNKQLAGVYQKPEQVDKKLFREQIQQSDQQKRYQEKEKNIYQIDLSQNEIENSQDISVSNARQMLTNTIKGIDIEDQHKNFQIYKYSYVKFKKEGDKFEGDAKLVLQDEKYSRIMLINDQEDTLQDDIQILELWKRISTQQSVFQQKFCEDLKVERFILTELNKQISKFLKLKDDEKVKKQVKTHRSKIRTQVEEQKQNHETLEHILKQFHQFDHDFVFKFVTSVKFTNQILQEINDHNN